MTKVMKETKEVEKTHEHGNTGLSGFDVTLITPHNREQIEENLDSLIIRTNFASANCGANPQFCKVTEQLALTFS